MLINMIPEQVTMMITNGTAAFNYANARAGNSPGFSLTFGLKLGWLVK